MIRAHMVISPSDCAARRALNGGYFVTLTRQERYRRRLAMVTECGREFLLDLPEATYLAPGAGLLLEDEGVVVVRAAREPLLKITAATPLALTKLAWHLGNRHTPAEVTDGAIYIQPDHVLADMVRGLGATVSELSRAFEPEGGAYGGHGAVHRGHHHTHDRDGGE